MSRLIRTIDGILSGIEWLGQLARQLRGLPPIANQPEQVKGMSDSTREHIRKQIDSAARAFPADTSKCSLCGLPTSQHHTHDFPPPLTETWACSHCGERMPTWVGTCTMCMRGNRPEGV